MILSAVTVAALKVGTFSISRIRAGLSVGTIPKLGLRGGAASAYMPTLAIGSYETTAGLTFRCTRCTAIKSYRSAIIGLKDIRMKTFMRKIKQKGRVSIFIDEINSLIMQNVGHIPDDLPSFSVKVKHWIESFALSSHAYPSGEPWSGSVIVAHMPFTDESSLITAFL